MSKPEIASLGLVPEAKPRAGGAPTSSATAPVPLDLRALQSEFRPQNSANTSNPAAQTFPSFPGMPIPSSLMPSIPAQGGEADFIAALGKGVVKLVGDGLKFSLDMLSDPEKRREVAQAIVSGAVDAAQIIGKVVEGFVTSAVDWAKEIATNPEKRKELLEKIEQGLERLWAAATDPQTYIKAAQATGQAVHTLVTDPEAAWKAVVSAAKFGADIIGLTDVWLCGKEGLLAISAYGKGKNEEALGHFGQAAFHGVFAAASVGSMAATVSTVGAAGGTVAAVAAGRMAGKEAVQLALESGARTILREGGERIGKEVVGEITEKLGKDALEKTLTAGAHEIVDQGVRELSEKVAREGVDALSTTSMREAMDRSAGEVTQRLMKDWQVEARVSDKTVELLTEMAGKSQKELTAILTREGVERPSLAARQFAEALKTGKADELLQEILVDSISREINQMVSSGMERAFKERLRQALVGELTDADSARLAKAVAEQAKKSGKEVRVLVDDYVEAGWKGAQEGIEREVREAVARGVRDGFERFRERRRDDSAGTNTIPRSRRHNGPALPEPSVPPLDIVGGGLQVGGVSSSQPYFAFHDATLLQQLDRDAAQLATATRAENSIRPLNRAGNTAASTTETATTPTPAATTALTNGSSSNDIG